MITFKKLYEWEIRENITTQRIIRALRYTNSVLIKADDNYCDYVIKFDPLEHNDRWVRISKDELLEAYAATKKYKDLYDIGTRIMAEFLGQKEIECVKE